LSADSDRLPVAWHPRATPLVPLGLVAAPSGPARALARRLLAGPDEALLRLKGVAGSDLLVVLGAERDLPWADGVTYVGRDERAPALLLPTSLEPDVALPLLQQALLRRLADPLTPVAVSASPALLVPTGGARPLERSALASWLAAQGP
jgi:hypothetical protein